MTFYKELSHQARAAYEADRMVEAALLFRRAAEDALEIGDRRASFVYTFWAADSTIRSGDESAALALLIAGREREPDDAPAFEAWSVRNSLFSIVLSTQPRCERLEELLDDLQDYARSHSVPAGDVPLLVGDLSRAKGDWLTALTHYESGWQRCDGLGYIKPWHGYLAGYCCLEINRPARCRDWIDAIANHDDDRFRAVTTVWMADLEVRLGLAECRPPAELTLLLRKLTDRVRQTQRANTAHGLRELTVRVRLLDTPGDDPCGRWHAARQEFPQRQHSLHDLHLRYDVRLLLVDYRLACLRFAAGIPPVDDRYYRRAPEVPRVTPDDIDDFQLRLQKVRAAAHRALRSARRLDEMLKCVWRQHYVAARQKRIEEVAHAAGF